MTPRHQPSTSFRSTRLRRLAERLEGIRQRRSELAVGQEITADHAEAARLNSAAASMQAALAHDKLVEYHDQAAAGRRTPDAERHRAASAAHREASDDDLRTAFDQ
jgi:hypothetical protein